MFNDHATSEFEKICQYLYRFNEPHEERDILMKYPFLGKEQFIDSSNEANVYDFLYNVLKIDSKEEKTVRDLAQKLIPHFTNCQGITIGKNELSNERKLSLYFGGRRKANIYFFKDKDISFDGFIDKSMIIQNYYDLMNLIYRYEDYQRLAPYLPSLSVGVVEQQYHRAKMLIYESKYLKMELTIDDSGHLAPIFSIKDLEYCKEIAIDVNRDFLKTISIDDSDCLLKRYMNFLRSSCCDSFFFEKNVVDVKGDSYYNYVLEEIVDYLWRKKVELSDDVISARDFIAIMEARLDALKTVFDKPIVDISSSNGLVRQGFLTTFTLDDNIEKICLHLFITDKNNAINSASTFTLIKYFDSNDINVIKENDQTVLSLEIDSYVSMHHEQFLEVFSTLENYHFMLKEKLRLGTGIMEHEHFSDELLDFTLDYNGLGHVTSNLVINSKLFSSEFCERKWLRKGSIQDLILQKKEVLLEKMPIYVDHLTYPCRNIVQDVLNSQNAIHLCKK